MRIAYAILVHRSPEQLARLVRALAGPGVIFAVHVDRGAAQAPFEQSLADLQQVFFVKQRLKVYLFSYRLVEAALQCFELALCHKADLIVLLSGQDYPLRPAEDIRSFFMAHPEKQFIDYAPIGPQFWQERIDHLYFNTMQPLPLQRLVNKVAKFLPRRRPEMALYGGSAWVTVSACFARHLLASLGESTPFRRFLRFSHVPEELAIQTVALNSRFADTVVNDNLRYIRWKPGATHPDVFAQDDFGELMASGKLFARKFDQGAHPTLLDRLDADALHLHP